MHTKASELLDRILPYISMSLFVERCLTMILQRTLLYQDVALGSVLVMFFS